MIKRLLPFIIVGLTGFSIAFGETILFIGDSITDGNWGSPDKYPCNTEERNLWDKNHILGHGYVEMTAGYYMGENPEKGYNFINRGISGETLVQIGSRWDKDVIANNPDVVSILCGTNDIHYWLEKNPNELTEFNFDKYEVTLDSLIEITNKKLPGCRILLCTPFIAPAGEIGKSPQYILRKSGVDSIAGITRKIALKHKPTIEIGLVDFNELLPVLLRENDDPSYWIWDGIHPTTAMHYRMSRKWIQDSKINSINNILKEDESGCQSKINN